jgi:hypothetical protein
MVCGVVCVSLQSWCDDGEPKVMWLAGMHAPETYLAALVQMACRDRGWPLDRSTLYTQVRATHAWHSFIHVAPVAEAQLMI